MPEGPEVHIIGSQLNRILSGRQLKNITIHGGRYKTHGAPEGWPLIDQAVSSAKVIITSVRVKGKLIYWQLSNGWYLLNTLGMSGSWRQRQSKHCDVSFTYEKKRGGNARLWFKDQRHFGTLKFVDQSEMTKKLHSIGPDVLTSDFTLEKMQEICSKNTHWSLAKLLMNQKKLSGIGNYLKCEILYAAELSPHRDIASLNSEDVLALYKYCKSIPIASLEKKGVSIRDYASPDDSEGSYQFSLKVYMKAKDPFGNKVKKEKTEDKRTTHWVPTVQK
jgi:DNA-formamidopyrimidine glycosylase